MSMSWRLVLLMGGVGDRAGGISLAPLYPWCPSLLACVYPHSSLCLALLVSDSVRSCFIGAVIYT